MTSGQVLQQPIQPTPGHIIYGPTCSATPLPQQPPNMAAPTFAQVEAGLPAPMQSPRFRQVLTANPMVVPAAPPPMSSPKLPKTMFPATQQTSMAISTSTPTLVPMVAS